LAQQKNLSTQDRNTFGIRKGGESINLIFDVAGNINLIIMLGSLCVSVLLAQYN
jgi:hypothetical protein